MIHEAGNLLTPEDLAAHFGVTVAKVMEWQRTYDWPRVKVGRTIRWTAEQVAKIEQSHSVAPSGVKPKDGRTPLSARRSA